MRLTFVGHQTLLAETKSGSLLVDPILVSGFGGDSVSGEVEIYPPRWVDASRMPVPRGVVLTHEHSDHFNIPSLTLLPRAVPVFVGPLMIDAVVECIGALGFQVTRIPFGCTQQLGDLEFTLFPAGYETVLWEARVSQVHIAFTEERELGGVLLVVDALISDEFREAVDAGTWPPPRVVAVSNNAQVTPIGVFGSLDNLKAKPTQPSGNFPGLAILHSLVCGYFQGAYTLRGTDILITGGGFLKDYPEMGPFPFSEQKDLAKAASVLLSGLRVHGPLPGEAYELTPDGLISAPPADWIRLDQDRFRALRERRRAFLAASQALEMKPRLPPLTDAEEAEAVSVVSAELNEVVVPLLLSPLGRSVLRTSAQTLAIKLLTAHQGDLDFVLDATTGRFEPRCGVPLPQLTAEHPFGLVVAVQDFRAVLSGQLQIWDLAGVAMRAWYEGPAEESIVAFLYGYYGEQVQPGRACKAYWDHLDDTSGAGVPM